MRLITIPMSHYCEKARWALDHAGVLFQEEAHLQVMHYWAVRSLNSGGMVPVLIDENSVIAGSARIAEYLDAGLPPQRKLYPLETREAIMASETYFDEGLGIESRRWVYFHWLNEPVAALLDIAAQGIPTWQRQLSPWLFPLFRRYLKQHLSVNAESVLAGRDTINRAFDSVAETLADGRSFLFGDRITAADISFASMASPLLLPPEYGIRLPTVGMVPAAAIDDVRAFRAHPAGQFALRLFREHRRDSTERQVVDLSSQ